VPRIPIPWGRQLCDDVQQVKRIFDAIRRAVETSVPVKAGWGSGREDRMDGQTLAVLYNFACHPLWGDPHGAITADFPGVASRVIEENLGPDSMALFLQGAAGDVVDVKFKDFTRPRDIEPHGVKLGQSALHALRNIATEHAGLSVESETIALPRRTDISDRVAGLLRRQDELIESLQFTTLNFETFLPLYMKYRVNSPHPPKEPSTIDTLNHQNMDKYLKNLRAIDELVRIQDDVETLRKHQSINDEAGEATIPAEVQGIKIGDCVIVTSPAEVLTEVGLNVKKASPYKHTFVAAFSNGYLHYGPPADDYDKGGYEVTECLLAPEWQVIFEKTAQEIIGRL
jgi:hypothetical protein